MDPSPVDDHVLTVHGAAEVHGAKLAEVLLRSDYRNVNRIAACLLSRCLELTVATVTMLRL